MNLTKFIEAKRAMKEVLAATGQEALAPLFLEFFAETPGIVAVRWTQYTPSFNDGEPCTFRVSEVVVRESNKIFTKEEEEEADSAEEGGFQYDFRYASYDHNTRKNLFKTDAHKVIHTNMTKLSRALNDIEEVLEQVFGNGKEITVTNNAGILKFSVEDCDCGY